MIQSRLYAGEMHSLYSKMPGGTKRRKQNKLTLNPIIYKGRTIQHTEESLPLYKLFQYKLKFPLNWVDLNMLKKWKDMVKKEIFNHLSRG
jgi:hypothetical protein